jgi:hypothetical protein
MIWPDAALAAKRISGLYRENIAQMAEDDIVIASCGGAGQSLIGNILFELGLNYVDAYTELLQPDGSAIAVGDHAGYRRHLASLHDKDTEKGDKQGLRLRPRFIKDHHPPVVFGDCKFGGVWMLVRDPRDALYSLYEWRRSFAEEEWDRVPATFGGYLRGPGDFTSNPVDDWVAFYNAWEERARDCDSSVIIRFEDLKADPFPVLRDALRPLGLDVSAAALHRAIAAITFEKMRAHEETVTGSATGGQARMIRSGRTDGWQDWMTPELSRCFSGAEFREVARKFGYRLAG